MQPSRLAQSPCQPAAVLLAVAAAVQMPASMEPLVVFFACSLPLLIPEHYQNRVVVFVDLAVAAACVVVVEKDLVDAVQSHAPEEDRSQAVAVRSPAVEVPAVEVHTACGIQVRHLDYRGTHEDHQGPESEVAVGTGWAAVREDSRMVAWEEAVVGIVVVAVAGRAAAVVAAVTDPEDE